MNIENLTSKQIKLISNFLVEFMASSEACQSCCFCNNNACFFASACIFNYLQIGEYNFFKKAIDKQVNT